MARFSNQDISPVDSNLRPHLNKVIFMMQASSKDTKNVGIDRKRVCVVSLWSMGWCDHKSSWEGANLLISFSGWTCNPVPGPQDTQGRVAIIVTGFISFFSILVHVPVLTICKAFLHWNRSHHLMFYKLAVKPNSNCVAVKQIISVIHYHWMILSNNHQWNLCTWYGSCNA